MPRSLRSLLEDKIPAPLADIVVDYLQRSRESYRAQYGMVLGELRYVLSYGVSESMETPDRTRHLKKCLPCRLTVRWFGRFPASELITSAHSLN